MNPHFSLSAFFFRAPLYFFRACLLVFISLLLSACFSTEETPLSVEAKYRDSGELWYEIAHYEDERSIQTYYYRDGSPQAIYPLKQDKLHGVAKEFDINGVLQEETSYVYGLQKGLIKRYYSTGELRSEGEYYKLRRHGYEKYYRRNGSLDREAKFSNGKLIGKRTFYDENGNLEQREFIERTGPRVIKAE